MADMTMTPRRVRPELPDVGAIPDVRRAIEDRLDATGWTWDPSLSLLLDACVVAAEPA